MPKSYHKADAEVLATIEQIRNEHHPDLVELEVRIGAILIGASRDPDTGQPVGPAISDHGATVAARIRITTAKQRVHLPYDAMIEIDYDLWQQLEDDGRAALIDHELTHLVVVRDRNGAPVQGDDLRPRLKMRPDDWKISGFIQVVQRHGAAALEYQSMDKLLQRHGYRQLLFPWMMDVCGPTPEAAIESVTLEHAGRSVTLTADTRKRIDAALAAVER